MVRYAEIYQLKKSLELSNIAQEIFDFIKAQYSLYDIEFSGNTDLILKGIIDSMQVIELIMHLEKEYDVEFTEDDLLDNSISSVDGLACLIHSKV